jgi:hypothetical protein
MMNDTLNQSSICVTPDVMVKVLSQVVLMQDAIKAAEITFIVGVVFGLVMAYTIPKLVRWYFAPTQRT